MSHFKRVYCCHPPGTYLGRKRTSLNALYLLKGVDNLTWVILGFPWQPWVTGLDDRHGVKLQRNDLVTGGPSKEVFTDLHPSNICPTTCCPKSIAEFNSKSTEHSISDQQGFRVGAMTNSFSISDSFDLHLVIYYYLLYEILKVTIMPLFCCFQSLIQHNY